MANEFRFHDYPDAIKFTPATDTEVAALAEQYELSFSADYLAFLKTHNGFSFDELAAAAPLAPGIETFDFMRYLFGIDTGHQYNDLRVYLSMQGVWEKPIRNFAYPVGEGRGGDPIVQIYRGDAAGRIYFVDHEVFPDADDLKEEGIELAAMSADDAVAYLEEQGCFIAVAESFLDFLDKLVVYDDDGHINVSLRQPVG